MDTKSASSQTLTSDLTELCPLPPKAWNCSVPTHLLAIYPYLRWMLDLPIHAWGYDEATNCWFIHHTVTAEEKRERPGLLWEIKEIWMAFPSKEV